jgi:dTDP-4-dehydrorhamnose 3,5-epimerase
MTMRFQQTPLAGSYLINLDPKEDDRGFFVRTFCTEEFSKAGLESSFIQMNHSFSKQQGTLRGLHYQLAPKQEVKVVRCIQGALWDVILDLRPDSKTFGHWFGEILSAENKKMMYVPKGFAHGFLTLSPNTEILYLVSESYCKEKERGIRWDDPQFKIAWPQKPTLLSERDRVHPDYQLP